MICLHHTDPDGWCSAAIVKKFHEDDDNVRFHGITYGWPLPIDKIELNERVYIVDYSLKAEEWKALLERTSDVYWFDHHKTAIEDPAFPHHLPGVRIDGVAACELIWEYFYPGIAPPRSVVLTADWDIWQFDHDPETTMFFHGICNTEDGNKPDSAVWNILLHEDSNYVSSNTINDICQVGDVLHKYQDRKNKELVKYKSNIIWFEGVRVCVVNSTVYGSPLFKSIDPSTYDGLSVYSWHGKFWKISFYTTHDDVDMSKIAVMYGGGGHRAACGCELKRLPFDFSNTVQYGEDGNAIIPSATIGSRIRRWAMHRWCRGRLW